MDSKDTRCIKLQNKPQKIQLRGFPGGSVVKNLPANAGEVGSIPGSGRHRGEEMATHSVFLPGKSHRQRNLTGYSPRGHQESDTTESLNNSNNKFN